VTATSTMPAKDSKAHQQPLRLDTISIAVIVLFLGATALLLLAAPSALRIGFPVLATLAAALLFARSAPAYVSFVMWLWFLSPWLRRMVDFRTEFVATSPLLLAPVLATGIAGWTMLTRTRSLSRPGAIPFICAMAGIAYGTVIGVFHFQLVDIAQALVNWVPPILFGFFLYERRDLYTQFRRVIERTFLYGVLVMGAYGVYQFFLLPEWDSSWMKAMLTGSFGEALPLHVRVFSTMNAPAPFATYIMAGLLMMFSMERSWLRIPAALLGFFSFLLTTNRASWIGFLVGLIYLAMHLGMRQRIKLIAMALGCGVLLATISMVPAVNDVLFARFQSMLDPKNDVSYQARIDGHKLAFAQIAQEPGGEGMGTMDVNHNVSKRDSSIGPHDSTILEFLFSLGFAGTFIYFGGLAFAGYRLFGGSRVRDPFTISMIAITLSYFAQAILNSIMIGVLGFVVWLSIAMALAAREHSAESTVKQVTPFWYRPPEEAKP